MSAKKKSTVAKVKEVVADAASAVAHAAEAKVIEPVGKALGLTGGKKSKDSKSAAVRMMTRTVAKKQPAGTKGKARRGGSVARTSQKPEAGRGGKGR
jgi:hypothetical protein